MSALVGVFGPESRSSESAVVNMLEALRHRASGNPELASAPGALLAASRHDWERSVSGWSGPLIAENEQWIVAADASLYYLNDLRQHLPVRPRETGSANLLLSALQAWGPRFGQYVEGDFAIVAWEKARQRLLLARDFGGRRNLAYSVVGSSVIVASSADAVVRHQRVSGELDPGFIAAATSAVVGPGQRTAYRKVSLVERGVTLAFEHGKVYEADRWVFPPVGTDWEEQPTATAAEELRHLITEATRERLDQNRPTVVWMSGGWDSTSIFASAMAALEQGPVDRDLGPVLPVSMTYVADDIGNEEAHIRAISDRWKVPVTWVDSEKIPLYEDTVARAIKHDDPMAQPFESQMRTLSRVTRDLNARVALDGFGGDNIFMSSTAAMMSDHLFFGRWSELWKEWRKWPDTARAFARLAILPALTPEICDWIGTVRGKTLRGFFDQEFAPWIVPSRAVSAELVVDVERRPDESAGQYEIRKSCQSSLMGRAVSWNMAFGLDEGVQLRAPLFDKRVISFALARPMSDRGSAGDSKRILRRAMAGLIPDSVLAPRTRKTGTPAGYFRRQFQLQIRDQVQEVFGNAESNLEKLGLLDRSRFMEAVENYARVGTHLEGAILQQTIAVERWLAVRRALG